MAGDGEVIYQLRLPGGKYYVGRTTRPHLRLAEHTHQPGPWVRRWGAPEALFIVERVAQRGRGGGQEEAVVAHLMWTCGANAVRGGSRLGPQDYTQADAAELARFIGTQLGMDLDLVRERLRANDELPRVAACLGCGGATRQGRPRCFACFAQAATCRGCGALGHVQRDCTAEAPSCSQLERAAPCIVCRDAVGSGDGAVICSGCFLACSACYDCGLCGTRRPTPRAPHWRAPWLPQCRRTKMLEVRSPRRPTAARRQSRQGSARASGFAS